MKSDTVKSDGLPNWLTIYEAAVMERDKSKALERIAQAEMAIRFRLMALKDSSKEGSEGEVLANALTVLHQLREVNDGHSRGGK